MKVRPSVKPICEKCKVIRRKGRVMVICENLSTSKDRVNTLNRLFSFGSGCSSFITTNQNFI